MIEIYPNFFSEEVLEKLELYASAVVNDPLSKYRTNITSWNPNIVGDSSVILIHDFNKTYLQIVAEECQRIIGEMPTNVMFQFFTNDAYIPWHEDDHVSRTGTLYLNSEWNVQWGGLLQHLNGDKIETLVPAKNLFVSFTEGVFHATTKVNSGAPTRTSIQMFFAE